MSDDPALEERAREVARDMLLEQLYLVFLSRDPDGAAVARIMHDAQVRMVEDEAPRGGTSLSDEQLVELRRHVVHRLDWFWERVGGALLHPPGG